MTDAKYSSSSGFPPPVVVCRDVPAFPRKPEVLKSSEPVRSIGLSPIIVVYL